MITAIVHTIHSTCPPDYATLPSHIYTYSYTPIDDNGVWITQRVRTLHSTCPSDYASLPYHIYTYSYSPIDDNGVWTIQRVRTLHSTCPPDYATLPSSMGSRNRLVISGEKPFEFISDSLIQVEDEPDETEEEKGWCDPCPSIVTVRETLIFYS